MATSRDPGNNRRGGWLFAAVCVALGGYFHYAFLRVHGISGLLAL